MDVGAVIQWSTLNYSHKYLIILKYFYDYKDLAG